MSTKTTVPELIDPDVLQRAADVLRVLAHPARLRIVELLLIERHRVADLADALDLAPNAVSQHLNLMKAHGLLAAERDGRKVHYRVINPHAGNVIDCIRRHGGGKQT